MSVNLSKRNASFLNSGYRFDRGAASAAAWAVSSGQHRSPAATAGRRQSQYREDEMSGIPPHPAGSALDAIELGSEGLSAADVVAVARRDARGLVSPTTPSPRWRRAPRSSPSWPAPKRPRTASPPGSVRSPWSRSLRAARGAPAGADPLARGRDGAAGRARGGSRDDAAARADARDGLVGRAAGGRRSGSSRCSTRGSRRSCPSTARSERAATSPRSPTARWR